MTSVEVPKAGRREWFGLVVLALPTLMVAFDIFVLLLALPSLATDLGADGNQQLWIMDIYGFMLAGFLLTMGNLGDRIGRRKLLLIGASAFGLASVLAAFSTTPEMLIFSRALLGVAGATLAPSTLALISNIFQNPKERAMAIGIWGGTWTLGAIIGPAVGGLLLANFWWGSVFLLGVPAMALLLIVGPTLLPEYRNTEARRLDLPSVALSMIALLPSIWGIKELARHGWEVLPLGSLLVGLAFAAIFIQRQRRLADPLLDLRLFGYRGFNTALGGLFIYSFVGGSTMLFMNLYFQLVGGLSTVEAGLAMIPGAIAGTIAFAITPVLAGKIRPAFVIAGGLVGAAVMMLVLTQVKAEGGTTLLIVGFSIFSFFGVPTVALGTNLVVSAAPPEKGGVVGSLSQLSNEFGATLGAALLGTVGFAVYRNQVDDKLPADLPDGAAAAAGDSLAGAAAVLASLPERVAAAVQDVAQAAFATGLHVVVAINAVLLAGLAVLVATTLKHIPPFGTSQGPGASGADAPDEELSRPHTTPMVAAEDARD
ncbi:MFS transporter [Micromonospora sp. NPDC051543]|uniref:MFS transporter n=1 Tax=Micromonospora sp. NPDC051543 TaxID=3364287 RepID=UPI0037B2EFD2